ncbi:SUF system NifU family Fe-S cluster assembly protein [Candidatus Pacearchaeota archaeon]|nr:SUF system NifU family Fe-S cluster assembly protein [Candidatus Pacearchaeota archaeon]MBI2056779.1 SUF system NifU family Fe-S cluster assembly protein [Candidatus Pacearchaeota archaeon]
MSLEMYKEHILDLYKNPHNKGNLENPTYEFSKNNPLCGDEIKIQIIAKNNKITNIKFNGIGCAISQASASLLTDKIKNMKVESAKKLTKEDILEMIHIPISHARLKCALLPLEAMKGVLENA